MRGFTIYTTLLVFSGTLLAQLVGENSQDVQVPLLHLYSSKKSEPGTLIISTSGISWSEPRKSKEGFSVQCNDLTFSWRTQWGKVDDAFSLHFHKKNYSFTAETPEARNAAVNGLKRFCNLTF